MSLATSAGGGFSGAGASGGLAMAHGANAGMQVHQQAQANFQGHAHVHGTAAPTNVAALGADLIDKSQTSLSTKLARNLSALPLVAIDLYGSGEVAYFPPKAESLGVHDQDLVTLMGSVPTNLIVKKDDERAYKALRRLLRKSVGNHAVVTTALGATGVKVIRPHLLLGARNLDQINPTAKDRVTSGEDVTLANSSLDGSPPTGDDYDRVVLQCNVHSEKKALSMLPEEAVSVILDQAKHLVSKMWEPSEEAKKAKGADDEDEQDAFHEFPLSVALPGWASYDSSLEALIEATGGTGVFHPRPVAALCGALQHRSDKQPNAIMGRILKAWEAGQKMREKEAHQNSEEHWDEYHPLVIMAGLTTDGIELSAMEVSRPQNEHHAVFGNFKVLTTVAYQHGDPTSLLQQSWKELQNSLELVDPDSEGPVVVITYGTTKQQETLKSKLEAILKKDEDWKGTHVQTTKEEVVARGAAVLGATSHGRIQTLSQQSKGKKKSTELALAVQNVAPCAVGIRTNYYGDDAEKWSPVKTIFDFDKRVPAGPYPVELSAAESAAIRDNGAELDHDKILDHLKKFEGVKKIPQREEAALNLRVEIMQMCERNGKWVKVGDTFKPLVNKDRDEKEIACESAVMEISLAPSGIITSMLQGDGQSVVQANTSARNSTIRYYLFAFLAVAFFGGFLVKSYLEEYFFNRDTDRLLAYYKRVLPGSTVVTDRYNAMSIVWKYRYNKAKLWRRLEAKYGVPVLQPWEWDDDEDDENKEEDATVEDLDEEASSEGENEKTGAEQDL